LHEEVHVDGVVLLRKMEGRGVVGNAGEMAMLGRSRWDFSSFISCHGEEERKRAGGEDRDGAARLVQIKRTRRGEQVG
jgi:hypothetical protein